MLLVLNERFERIGMITKFEYLLWRKKYSSVSEFELRTKTNFSILKKGYFIYKKDDKELMRIYNRKLDDKDGDTLIVTGKSILNLLALRIIWEQQDVKGKVIDCIKSLLNSEVIAPKDIKRKMSFFNVASETFGVEITLQAQGINLLEQVESLLKTYDIGISQTFDLANRISMIAFYTGADRTTNQKVLPRVILSKKFATVTARTFEENDANERNTCFIVGENLNTTIEQGEGMYRKELLVDASGVSRTKKENNTDVTISEEDYILLLKQNGLAALLENTEEVAFDCSIDVNRKNVVYGRDFFLGDIVTIRDDSLDLTFHKRIVEVDEVYQNNEKTVNVTVGEPLPTLAEKIKRMVK